jgi:hypothetical protein
MINEDRKIDVLAILDVQADWSKFGHRLGICQFRRTWSNSLAIDSRAAGTAKGDIRRWNCFIVWYRADCETDWSGKNLAGNNGPIRGLLCSPVWRGRNS